MSVVTLTATDVKGAYAAVASAVVDLDRKWPIQAAAASTKTFTLADAAGDQTALFAAGTKVKVTGSTGNDGAYTVVSSAFGTATAIVVEEAVVDGTDGDVTVLAFQPAATGGNTNDFVATGRELVLVRNVHATLAKTFSVVSVANAKNRLGSITDHSLPAGALAIGPFFKLDGWASGGTIACSGEDANIEFCVLRLPTQ